MWSWLAVARTCIPPEPDVLAVAPSPRAASRPRRCNAAVGEQRPDVRGVGVELILNFASRLTWGQAP